MSPAKAELLGLHAQIAAGNNEAWRELSQRLFLPLFKSLSKEFDRIPDEHLLMDAVTEALVHYRSHPERYKPKKASIRTYLRGLARGFLLHGLRKIRTWRRHEVRSCKEKRRDPPSAPQTPLEAEELKAQIIALIDQFHWRDRMFMMLYLRGIRKVDVLVTMIGARWLTNGKSPLTEKAQNTASRVPRCVSGSLVEGHLVTLKR